MSTVLLGLFISACIIAATEAYESYPRVKQIPGLKYAQQYGRMRRSGFDPLYPYQKDILDSLLYNTGPIIVYQPRRHGKSFVAETLKNLKGPTDHDLRLIERLERSQKDVDSWFLDDSAGVPLGMPGFNCMGKTVAHLDLMARDLSKLDAMLERMRPKHPSEYVEGPYLGPEDYRRFAKRPPVLRLVPKPIKGDTHGPH